MSHSGEAISDAKYIRIRRGKKAENVEQTDPYVDEWKSLFGSYFIDKQNTPNYNLDDFRNRAFEGRLQQGLFRSVLWRLYLKIILPDSRKWLKTLSRERKTFAAIDKKANPNPRIDNYGDHPLSVSPTSIWNYYFQSMDEKKLLYQDVDRLFPDVHYFRRESVQDMIVNILFCYTKNFDFPYRQGMHTLIGPLIYSVYADCRAFHLAAEEQTIPKALLPNLKILFDMSYLEADVFAMFKRVMDIVKPWYLETVPAPIDLSQSKQPPDTQEKFLYGLLKNDCSSKDSDNQNPVILFLDDIHEKQLKHLSPKIYEYLNKIEIIPVLFGLRWLRLLFCHEFPFYEILNIWDFIFATENTWDFIRSLYLSMLLHVAPLLLQRNFADCLQVLLNFPPHIAVSDVLDRALQRYSAPTEPTRMNALPPTSPPRTPSLLRKGVRQKQKQWNTLSPRGSRHPLSKGNQPRPLSTDLWNSLDLQGEQPSPKRPLNRSGSIQRDSVPGGVRSAFSSRQASMECLSTIPDQAISNASLFDQEASRLRDLIERISHGCIDRLSQTVKNVDLSMSQIMSNDRLIKSSIVTEDNKEKYEISRFIQIRCLQLAKSELTATLDDLQQLLVSTAEPKEYDINHNSTKRGTLKRAVSGILIRMNSQASNHE